MLFRSRKRFFAKYGSLAEQKLRETAEKLAQAQQREAYGDAMYGMTGMVSSKNPAEDPTDANTMPIGGTLSRAQIDAEKQSIFGFKDFNKRKKLNRKK